MEIPLNAKVECADGPGGESIAVVVNPVTEEVTHLVVQDLDVDDSEPRLVPIVQVVETTRTLVRLGCTQDELAKMESFVERHYVPKGEDYSQWQGGEYNAPYATTSTGNQFSEEDAERIPAGELAVHRGDPVSATDGSVGEVGELLIDGASGHVTHLVLREGHLLGKREVTLPVSTIDHVEDDTVYLKLDKAAVEALPAVQITRHYEKAVAEGKNVELIAKVYDDLDGASEAMEFVKDLQKQHVLKILNAAVVVKDEDGNVSLEEKGDVDAKHGRLFGAVTGGLIGLVGGPVGVVVGALAGAGVGGLAANWIDMGFSDQFLNELKERLEPGSSALIILVEDKWVVKASESLSDTEGLMFQQTLTDEMVRRMTEEGETEE
jgi:uncharacterized membrane protein/sporulation protein YlmC with PRC-barrel domain